MLECRKRDLGNVSVGEPVSAAIVADELKAIGEKAVERASELHVPIVFEVIEPCGRPHERQALAGRCHRQLDAVLGAAELDVLIGTGRRVLGDLRWLEGKKIAATWDGLDDPVILVAQGMPHVSDALDQCIVGDEEPGPDCLDQLVLADHPARVLDKIAQDVEGFGPQLNVVVTAPQRASLQVQSVVVETHDAWGGGRHVLIPSMAS